MPNLTITARRQSPTISMLIGEAEPDELDKSESDISIGELDPEEM